MDMETTIFDRFQVVNTYPVLYIPDLDTLVLSDLHLGLESLMAKGGVYMPKTQLETVKEDLSEIVDEVQPSRIIVCGDIKHEFSETTYGEREEVQGFIDFLTELVDDILLVKGNHDNFLIYYVEDYDNVELEEYFVLDDILFVHGHEIVEDLKTRTADFIIMGHEHPSLALRDRIGVTEKIHCFLYGELDDGRNLIVLPAFSSLAEGTPMNRVNGKDPDILSPFLKNMTDIQSLKAIGVDREAGVFEFPEIGKL